VARNLLIEIGTEEIPAGYLEEASLSFEEIVRNLFKKKKISFSKSERYYTPRRITIIFNKVAEKQNKIVREIKGPPVNVAFKGEKPTQAAKGFADSKGVPIKELYIKEFNGKEYVVAEVEEERKRTVQILKNNLPDIIEKIEFPKRMRWEETNFSFARPIRWIVALFNDKIIKFSIAGLESGEFSRGHRIIAPGRIKIKVLDYVKSLNKSYVMVDFNSRKKKLSELIIDEAKKVGGTPILREELINEVVNLIEYPFVILGKFSSEFLQLPEQVVITAMESHQRYFPVKKGKKLLPYFISIINNFPNKNIIKENEKVLQARLEDAKFYWEMDKKVPIEERVSQLSGIIWHKSLGTLLDKSKRIVKLAEWIGKKVGKVDLNVIKQGARLAKADLTTLMIRDGKEFTNLEGFIGSCYAKEEGFSENVCKVIEEHYRPRYANDKLPTSKEGAVVSLADRIDLVVGSFLAGEKPTGSRDPLGLRKAMNGFIRIIIEFEFDLPLKELINKNINEFKVKTKTKTIEEIHKFAKDRIEGYLQSIGIRYDVANAVLSEGWENIRSASLIGKSMMRFREDEEEFEKLVIGQKRVSNILQSGIGKSVKKSLLIEKEEKELYKQAKKIEPFIENFIKDENYLKALGLLKELRPFIDDLFDNVMVMTEDKKLRENRLTLLYYVRSLFHLLADFEEIVID
jgi:glycyl-tRNA synthetase beta chain